MNQQLARFMHRDVQIPLQESREFLSQLRFSTFSLCLQLVPSSLGCSTDTGSSIGSVRHLPGDQPSGRITFQPLGASEEQRQYQLARQSFACLLCK